MHLKSIYSIVAGILFFVAFAPYIRAIVRKSKAGKSILDIWASLDTITLAGMFAKHAVNGQIVRAILGAWIIVFLALKYGIPGFHIPREMLSWRCGRWNRTLEGHE